LVGWVIDRAGSMFLDNALLGIFYLTLFTLYFEVMKSLLGLYILHPLKRSETMYTNIGFVIHYEKFSNPYFFYHFM
jgi:hypothetical protein